MNSTRSSFFAVIVALALVRPAAADSFRAFGLTNTPIGDAGITFQNGTMTVTSPGESGVSPVGGELLPAGTFGVSIQLGDADAGVWVWPYHNGYVNSENFMVGQVFGDLNGQAEQAICTVRARRENEGAHSVEVDFSPIGAVMQRFEVYSGDTLMASATNTGGAAIVHTYGQSGPRVNPFWRLPDGRIATVVELSETDAISLPGQEEIRTYGNRLVIGAVAPIAEVKFVSRVDVTGGDGLDHFLITGMGLGVFNHGHIAIGPALLNAAAGKLEVANPDFGPPGVEHGVSIELEGLSCFDLKLLPVELGTNGAALVASAVARVKRISGEFVGYAGVRNSNGVLQAFASLPSLEPELQIAIYRDGCLVGTRVAPSSLAVVALSGTPRVTGFGATAVGLKVRAGFAITLDALTSFTLPDGAVLEGDQVRFRAPSPVMIERLTTFSLVASNLAGFTLCGETTPQTITLLDYLADLEPGASTKRFNDGLGGSFLRTVGMTNRQGQSLVLVTDTYSSSNSTAEYYRLQDGELHFHGGAQLQDDSFSAAGLRVLPEQVRLGPIYTAAGSFLVSDPASGQPLAQTTTLATRAAEFEMITVPAGTFSALRIESTERNTLYLPAGLGAPSTQDSVLLRTNWLVAGLGVVKFSMTAQDGAVLASGELADYNLITSQPRDQTVSLGASVVLAVTLNVPSSAAWGDGSFVWRRDGVTWSNSSFSTVLLLNVTSADAGQYSVVVSNSAGMLTNEVGSLKVVPFSDPSCFWAQRAGGTEPGVSQATYAAAVVTDAANNLYVVGAFDVKAVFGSFTLISAGSRDIYVAKLSPTGEYLWAVRGGGPSAEFATAAGLDAAGNLYIAGTFDGTATFGTNTLTATGNQDAFVVKMDSNGNFLWAVQGGGGGYDYVIDVAVQPTGNLYLTGSFEGTATFGDTLLTGSGGDNYYYYSLFVARLDANGNFLWARSADSAYPTALAVEPGGDVYLAGGFYPPTTVGGITLTARRNESGFLARIEQNGDVLWAHELADGAFAHDLAVDAAGNLLVAGGFSGLARFGPFTLSSASTSRYYPELFLAKLDHDGHYLWARKAAGSSYYNSTRLAVDGNGNAYTFSSLFTFADVGTAMLYPGDTPLLLSKMDSLGHTVWVKQFGGDSYPRALTTDAGGNVYLAGSFNQSARFGDLLLSSTPSIFYNVFVVKMCGPLPPGITVQPQSMTVNAGADATFSVTAASTAPLTYQWRKSGATITGATSNSLTISNAQAADADDYSVSISNDGGSVSSTLATLAVTSPYAGTLMFGAANYSVSETSVVAVIDVLRTGSSAGMVTVDFGTGDGTALADLDYLATAGTLRFADGESNRTFTVPILEDALFEAAETVVLRLCQPRGGAVLGSPATATLTILNDDSPAPRILSQPQSRGVVAGGSVSFSVTVTGQAPFHYQWRKNEAEIAGANNSTYAIAAVQFSDQGSYSVVIVSDFGETLSQNATLTVYPLPVIHQQPLGLTAARGGAVMFSVIASGFNTVTQTFNRVGGMEDHFTVETPGEAGRIIINYDFFTLPDSLRVYRGSIIFDTGLTNGSGTIHLFYRPPDSNPNAIDVVVNEGSTGQVASLWAYELKVISETLRYQWRKDGVLIPWGTEATLVLPYVTADSAGQYTVTVRDFYGSIVSQAATLLVVPPPPPTLRLMRLAETGEIRFSWDPPNFYLEAADEINGPWYYYEGTSVLIAPGDAHQFFRLREYYSGPDTSGFGLSR